MTIKTLLASSVIFAVLSNTVFATAQVKIRACDEINACVRLAIKAQQQEQYAEAVEYYTKAIAFNDTVPDLFFNRSIVYQKLGQDNKALFDLKKVLKLNPKDADAYYNKAMIAYNQNKTHQAMRDFDKAIQNNSNHYNAYYYKGQILYKKKKYQEALNNFTYSIQIKPAIKSITQRALTFIKLKNYEGAIIDFNLILDREPENTDALYNRALVYDILERNTEALADFNKLLEIDFENIEAYLHRGNIYKEQEQWDLALDDLDFYIANAKNPSDDAYGIRGIINLSKRHYANAIQDLNKAIGLNPKYAEYYFYLGLTFNKVEKYEEALKYVTQAIQLDDSIASYFLTRSQIHQKLGDSESSTSDYRIWMEMEANIR